ncbi:GTP cyclohydrolase I FolE [Candidatus Woesebacteria bacterium RIFCSPHIGHO2_01_FULL_44_10]|uniref:GTP cyclohydrolase 1 n=1 Tax=Candidatus Woesebacteria bacterium RIFCSPLOWO2_01_FULL_44_14 TaxID=1802525 RepID=A0A1F8C3Q7_9BACT|nr:MAG: GTP cyclohydrolase I FolE [Candidatus Woesebacteria bacterium RIFCSPHIGHO2_01_FULL_44_10]OGM54385.1 MAG: GTP cyclohydrolase I FolE [Candidatus Woesebacteria bacterium RIFCSPHIGHO2_12_FULL_44_11]OGM70288.1 MAG: GTP cyclohydrolase I FolE [Candidatus Woesebacteria bacterium RIFCSPLOWO2_01_FULL_44_14]
MATRNHTKLIVDLLELYGEDPNREGLKETPERVLRMYKELLGGYQQDPSSVIKTFEGNGHNDLVTVSDIDFYSLCEHHMIPFFGKVHIGYIPNGRILGLSKFVRLTEIYARRLQVQERLTRQIMDAIETNLHPQGAIVHVEAEHLCMVMRGVKKKGAITKTTALCGDFEKDPLLVDRFFRHINRSDNSK